MQYRILGPVEARRDETEIPLDGAKQRTVLSALLIFDGKIISDKQLSEYLWGQHPPATRNAQIYTYVSRLRKALGPDVAIVRRSPGYLLRIDSSWFDLTEFERLARLGQTALTTGRYEDAARKLRTALSLWRGGALANVSEYMTDIEGPRLEEARLTALESRIEADLALGRHTSLLPELTRLVRRYPLQERFRAQLMTMFHRSDRQADALAVYAEGRRILADELGIDPGSRLREMHQAILTDDPRLSAPSRRRVAIGY